MSTGNKTSFGIIRVGCVSGVGALPALSLLQLLTCYIMDYSTRDRYVLAHRVGSEASSPATPRVGSLPSGLVPHSSSGQCGVVVCFKPGWGVRLAALTLVLVSTDPAITYRGGRVRRTFSAVCFGGLGTGQAGLFFGTA